MMTIIWVRPLEFSGYILTYDLGVGKGRGLSDFNLAFLREVRSDVFADGIVQRESCKRERPKGF